MKNNTTKKDQAEDIHDPEKDEKQLQSEETVIYLPEVKDIPGQEHIRPPQLREFADTTIASDDEEGKGMLDDLNDESNVSPEEKELLEQSANSMGSEEDKNREKASLDNTDEEGELLNEQVDISGNDLDVPGAEEDDKDEEAGEEDEENNSYSLGGDKKD